MGEQNAPATTAQPNSVQTDFGWDMREVRKSLLRTALKNLKGSGVQGLAIVSAIAGLVWIAAQTLSANVDTLKVLCALGISGMLMLIAMMALHMAKEGQNATAKLEAGGVRSNPPGTGAKVQSPLGPTPGADGSPLDGGGHN